MHSMTSGSSPSVRTTSTSRVTRLVSFGCSHCPRGCARSRIRSLRPRTRWATAARRCPTLNRLRLPCSLASELRLGAGIMTNIDVGRAPAPQAEARTHKLWGGRFGAGPTPEFDALNNSIGVDFRLWPYDIRLSKAWAVALWGAGVLTLEESKAIETGLDAVSARLQGGEQPQASDEDVHTLIDRLLHEEIGDVASKLHTGRSRNDQVSTAARLWTMDACKRLDAAIRQVQHVIIDRATALEAA